MTEIAASGFTSRVLSPNEERALLERGLGITNVVERATASADELGKDELIAGGKILEAKVRLFRPQKHVERMNRSAERMCIPPLDPELALRSLVTLVGIERDWVPKAVGTSLYVRPTIVANEAFLGVRPAKSYIYFVILSPVGAYYPEGMAPVKIRVKEHYVRAVEGGLGGAKTGANYAASLIRDEAGTRAE